MKNLQSSYIAKKSDIRRRLAYFSREKNEAEIFAELAFCILTPQSKAVSCWDSIERLRKSGILEKGTESQIRKGLVCRFPNNKARYLVSAREFFNKNKAVITKMMDDPLKLRQYLVNNIKGFGYKEASHFLRNIGLGKDMAILDRHIIKNLLKYGAISEMPKTLTPRKYREIEEKMRDFSCKTGIPLDELDLLFWSEEAGQIFK